MFSLKSPTTWGILAFATIAIIIFAVLFSRGPHLPLEERLADDIQSGLADVRTVQGRLDISQQGAVLEQELWVQYPGQLRTETEAGPGAFSGTIVVLNPDEGWVYSPALNRATVVDRSEYIPDMAGEAGAGSLLERLPVNILAAVENQYPLNIVGDETVAGRNTIHLEFVIPGNGGDFPAGPLQVWLDKEYYYPLALQDSDGRSVRFRQVQFNEEIDPLTFEFVPPPGVSVQRVQPSQ